MGHHLEARDLEVYNVLYLTITQRLHGNFCRPLAFLRSFRMSHETSDSPSRHLRMAESIGKKLSPLTPVTAVGSRAGLGPTEEPLMPTDGSLNTQAVLGPWSPFSVSLQATARARHPWRRSRSQSVLFHSASRNAHPAGLLLNASFARSFPSSFSI